MGRRERGDGPGVVRLKDGQGPGLYRVQSAGAGSGGPWRWVSLRFCFDLQRLR